jgi:hypothetical protein
MKNFKEPEDALMEATRARRDGNGESEAFYLGYASGLTEAYRAKRRDSSLQRAKDPYARGYSAGYEFVAERDQVGSRIPIRR